jgi:mannitol/fructose-specific phosphotransferase system IIA component (Ntr-type)
MFCLSKVISPGAILCGCQKLSRDEFLDELVAVAGREYGWVDSAELSRRVREREAKMTTSIGLGIAVPHARMEDRDRIQVAAACVPAGVDFRASDGKPVRLVILLVSPVSAPGIHVQALASVSRISPQVVEQLVASSTPEDFLRILGGWESTFSR